jgi:hypothetical protein
MLGGVMDSVKALINVGDKSIQLEGERAFVEKYLDQYFTLIQTMSSVALNEISNDGGDPIEQENGNLPETENSQEIKAPIKRNRAKRLSGMPTCADRIRAIKGENYFSQLRTAEEILTYLKDNKGTAYDPNIIFASLSNFIKRGELRRIKEDGKYKYTNP